MTIEEAKILKAKAELQIVDIITLLQNSTGLKVGHIFITTEDSFGLANSIITNLEIELKMP